jgi:hypothetical protein
MNDELWHGKDQMQIEECANAGTTGNALTCEFTYKPPTGLDPRSKHSFELFGKNMVRVTPSPPAPQ